MRKFLLILLLAGIAFGAGALMNGPNQAKVRGFLAAAGLDRYLFPKHDEESTDDEPAEAKELPSVETDAASARPARVASASVGPKPTDAPAEAKTEERPLVVADNDPPRPFDPETLSSAPPVRVPSSAPNSASETPKDPTAAKTSSASAAGSEVSQPEIAKSADLVPERSSEVAAPGHASGSKDWPDPPGSAPAAAVIPKSGTGSRAAALSDPGETKADSAVVASANQTGTPGSPPVPQSDWSEIVRKMRKLGVTRYTLEGDPNGSVRFRCTAPMTDHATPSLEFEAEGDDAVAAAETALRRVMLWKVSEAAE